MRGEHVGCVLRVFFKHCRLRNDHARAFRRRTPPACRTGRCRSPGGPQSPPHLFAVGTAGCFQKIPPPNSRMKSGTPAPSTAQRATIRPMLFGKIGEYDSVFLSPERLSRAILRAHFGKHLLADRLPTPFSAGLIHRSQARFWDIYLIITPKTRFGARKMGRRLSAFAFNEYLCGYGSNQID